MHLEAEPLGRDCVAYANISESAQGSKLPPQLQKYPRTYLENAKIDLRVEGRTVKTVLFSILYNIWQKI